jgi:hypothetical protein
VSKDLPLRHEGDSPFTVFTPEYFYNLVVLSTIILIIGIIYKIAFLDYKKKST